MTLKELIPDPLLNPGDQVPVSMVGLQVQAQVLRTEPQKPGKVVVQAPRVIITTLRKRHTEVALQEAHQTAGVRSHRLNYMHLNGGLIILTTDHVIFSSSITNPLIVILSIIFSIVLIVVTIVVPITVWITVLILMVAVAVDVTISSGWSFMIIGNYRGHIRLICRYPLRGDAR